MVSSLDSSRTRATARRRLGFTMLEIMTSVTLSLMLMYAVARIFTRVGGTMNETTSVMSTINTLRNAKVRLTEDLENVTVRTAPPRNSRLGDGFLCYSEGLGAPTARLYNQGFGMRPATVTVDDVALDSERYLAYDGDVTDTDTNGRPLFCDSTVGDTDDILSFTAKAPAGKQFRGRYIRPVYTYDTDGVTVLNVSGVADFFYSDYAEIVWFVRGTNLYRRVLPLMGNKELQESLNAFAAGYAAIDSNCSYNQACDLRNNGCGFLRYYDVSVHLGADGTVEANTIGDL